MKVRKPTKARLERFILIEGLLNNGKSQSDIAKMLGISRQAINQLLHRERMNNRVAIYKAVKQGKIIKPVECDNCKATKNLEAHHPDHNNRFDIRWLCKECHMSEHSSIMCL